MAPLEGMHDEAEELAGRRGPYLRPLSAAGRNPKEYARAQAQKARPLSQPAGRVLTDEELREAEDRLADTAGMSLCDLWIINASATASNAKTAAVEAREQARALGDLARSLTERMSSSGGAVGAASAAATTRSSMQGAEQKEWAPMETAAKLAEKVCACILALFPSTSADRHT